MDVVFVLPRWSRVPIGGYWTVYAHADALAARGHRVSVLHAAALSLPRWRGPAAELWRRSRAGRSSRSFSSTSTPWYEHHPSVQVRSLLRLPQRWPSGTAVIATSWQTSTVVAERAAPGWGFSYLQSHETWSGRAGAVDATWRLPLHKIVIATWLADLADHMGVGPVDVCPNFIDEAFHAAGPSVERDPHTVGMLWHEHPVKGSDVGVAALELIKAEEPGLRARLFSVYERPAHLPAWIEWTARPSRPELIELLRGSAIFLSPSRMEGWALPPAEAMASGCALVATDIGGHRDYAQPGVTALLAPAEDPAALAAAVVRLVRETSLRRALAERGRERIGSFTKAASTAAFERSLVTRAGRQPARPLERIEAT